MKKRKHLNAFILSTIITLLIVYCAINRYIEIFIENYPIVVLSILVLIILAMIGIQIKNRVKEYKKNSKETLTFSEFNRYYSNISYTYKGLHTFGTNYSYDSDCHWQQCTKLNCNGKTNIGYHNFQQNNHGI